MNTPVSAVFRKVWLQLVVGLVLIGFWILLEVSGPKFFGQEEERALQILQKFVKVLFVLNAAWAVNRVITEIKEQSIALTRMPIGMRSLFYLLLRFTVFSLALLVVLDSIGISITPLIASLGVGSLAVALALQDTLGNLFSGFYMNIDRPISPGDWIELENKVRGQVQQIGWRTTRIALPDGNALIIPNSKLASAPITNFTVGTLEVGASLQVGIAYSSDLERTEAVAVEVAQEVLGRVPGGMTDPAPVARFLAFGDSAIDMKVFFRVRAYGDQFLATHEMLKALKKRFEAEGIDIPFPQRVVQISNKDTATH